MSKAVLVIDMPKDCNECPLMAWDDEVTEIHPNKWIGCVLNGKTTQGKKPKWCPLKELPNKMPQFFQNKKCFSDKDKGYFLGWNDCIKELLGDEDEID